MHDNISTFHVSMISGADRSELDPEKLALRPVLFASVRDRRRRGAGPTESANGYSVLVRAHPKPWLSTSTGCPARLCICHDTIFPAARGAREMRVLHAEAGESHFAGLARSGAARLGHVCFVALLSPPSSPLPPLAPAALTGLILEESRWMIPQFFLPLLTR